MKSISDQSGLTSEYAAYFKKAAKAESIRVIDKCGSDCLDHTVHLLIEIKLEDKNLKDLFDEMNSACKRVAEAQDALKAIQALKVLKEVLA